MTGYEDLIGLRYAARGTDPTTGVDCAWASRRALERIFPDFAAEDFPLDAVEEAAALALARAGKSSRWERVGGNVFAAMREGDLLLGTRDGGETFAAVLIDAERHDVLTALPGHGVTRMARSKLRGVTDVLRRIA